MEISEKNKVSDVELLTPRLPATGVAFGDGGRQKSDLPLIFVTEQELKVSPVDVGKQILAAGSRLSEFGIHLFIHTGNGTVPALSTEQLNALHIMGAYALRSTDGVTGSVAGCTYKHLCLRQDLRLLSLSAGGDVPLNAVAATEIVALASQAPPIVKAKQELPLPSLDDLSLALLEQRETSFVKQVEDSVEHLLRRVSASAQIQRKFIGGLLGVLNFSRELNAVNAKLGVALQQALARLHKVSTQRERDTALREIDACLYLAFELAPPALGPAFLAMFDAATIEMAPQDGRWLLLCRGLRHSFAKGLTLLKTNPMAKTIVKSTATEDAYAFDLIAFAMCADDPSALEEDGSGVDYPVLIMSLSKETVTALARDLRRTVPANRTAANSKAAEFIALIEQEIEKKAAGIDARQWLARCLVFLYVGGRAPMFLQWMQLHHARLGLSRVENDALAAVVGFDVPYVLRVNKNLVKSDLSFVVPAPSRFSNVRDFMRAALSKWEEVRLDSNIHEGAAKIGLVTVIFTTFKPDLELFGLSLRSILGQRHVPLEVIVIDDCSPEANSHALADLVERSSFGSAIPVRYHRNAQNIGQYASRNLAIEMASGQYIAIQDDDDISHPERLFRQIQPLLQDKSVVATHAQHVRVSECSRLMVDGEGIGEVEGDAPVSFIWRKSVFEEMGSFLPTRTRGDVEFRARMYERYGNNAVQIVSVPLVYMRGAMGTISANREYMYRSAVSALRFMMRYSAKVQRGGNVQDQRWIPTNLLQ